MMPNVIDLYAGRLPDLGPVCEAEDRPAGKPVAGKGLRALDRLAALTGKLLAFML